MELLRPLAILPLRPFICINLHSFIVFFFIHITSTAIIHPATAQQSPEDRLQGKEGIELMQELNLLAHDLLYTSTEKSVEYALRALELAEKLNDDNGTVDACLNLAQANELLKNYREALKYYEKSLSVFEGWGDENGKAMHYERIGRMNTFVGDFARAELNLNKAIAFYREAGNVKGRFSAMDGIGYLRLAQKRFNDAITVFQNIYQEAGKAHDDAARARAAANTGITYCDFGNLDEAMKYLNQALEIAKEKNIASQMQFITKNIDIVKENIKIRDESKSQYEKIEAGKQQEYMKDMEQKNIAYKQQQVKSLEEIEKLSAANQLKELKIRVQQDEYNKKIVEKEHALILKEQEADRRRMQAELKQRQLETANKDKKLQQAELERQQFINYAFLGGLVLLVMIVILIVIAYLLKRKSHKALEQKNKIINEQKEQIEKKNQTIISSIEYAKRIQDTILTPDEKLMKIFPESFVLFHPRDIVSGDFYWIASSPTSPPQGGSAFSPPPTGEVGRGTVLLACCDCTGHGVPGAFMSLLGFNMLKESAKFHHDGKPSGILNSLNDQVCGLMLQQSEGDLSRYGMDVSIVSFDFSNKQSLFSGAHHPLILVRKGEIHEFKGEKSIVGMKHKNGEPFFTDHVVPIQHNDWLYLFTDGYADQIGGTDKRKFYRDNFKKLLLEISQLPPEQQKQKLEETHINWKVSYPQTDDILVIGVKISLPQA